MIKSEPGQAKSSGNTPQIWDAWHKPMSLDEDIYYLIKEENSIRWQRMEKIVTEQFGGFKGLRVIEIGSGVGTNAALMAKRGAQVTVLDYSDMAIKRGKEFFERNKLNALFVHADVFSLPEELRGAYDISMSFGLAEHFKGNDRQTIISAHLSLLKKGCVSFIAVPHCANPLYRLYKFACQSTGLWTAGEEYPYSRKEMRGIMKKLEIKNYSFFGDSLYASYHFVNPMRVVRKLFKMKRPCDIIKIKKEKGSWLDQYFSYSLVVSAWKD